MVFPIVNNHKLQNLLRLEKFGGGGADEMQNTHCQEN
jgi:hypothetical protein